MGLTFLNSDCVTSEMMKVGDLVEVYRNPESNPIEEPSRIVGVLLDYDEEEEGWDVLVSDRIECYPCIWWVLEEVDHEDR